MSRGFHLLLVAVLVLIAWAVIGGLSWLFGCTVERMFAYIAVGWWAGEIVREVREGMEGGAQ
jgi:hypothetical protein